MTLVIRSAVESRVTGSIARWMRSAAILLECTSSNSRRGRVNAFIVKSRRSSRTRTRVWAGLLFGLIWEGRCKGIGQELFS